MLSQKIGSWSRRLYLLLATKVLFCSIALFNVVFTGRQTIEEYKRFVESVITRYKLADRLSCIVTDNAANARGGGKLKDIAHLNCFAHTLQLIVRASLKQYERLLRHARKIVTIFHRSTV